MSKPALAERVCGYLTEEGSGAIRGRRIERVRGRVERRRGWCVMRSQRRRSGDVTTLASPVVTFPTRRSGISAIRTGSGLFRFERGAMPEIYSDPLSGGA